MWKKKQPTFGALIPNRPRILRHRPSNNAFLRRRKVYRRLKRNILRREESRRSTPGQICTWVFAFPFPQHVRFFPFFLLLPITRLFTKLFTKLFIRLLATTLAIKNVQDHPCSSAMRSKSCINSCNCSRNVRNFSGACSSFFSHFSISPSAELRESRSTSSII